MGLTLRVCHYYTAVILAGYISCMCAALDVGMLRCKTGSLAAVPDTLIANTTLWGVDIERHRRYFSFNTSSINQSHSQDVDTNYIYGSVLRRAEMRCALVKLQNALAALSLAKVLTRRARYLAAPKCAAFSCALSIFEIRSIKAHMQLLKENVAAASAIYGIFSKVLQFFAILLSLDAVCTIYKKL
jgi:hypothetical protein